MNYMLPWRAARYVADRFRNVSRRLDALEARAEGAAAVYLGNNRLLVRSIVEGRTTAYLVQADDRLLTPWFAVTGQYELPVTDFLAHHLLVDSHCIDVGANFGYYTCLMARVATAGRVIGVEPEPEHFALLRDNIAINDLHLRARPLHAAVGDSTGTLTLHKRVTRAGNTSVMAPDAGFLAVMGEEESIAFEVPCTTLDQLAIDMGGRVDFAKVDVEGFEAAVLRGGQAAVAANPHMHILLEWSPGQMAAAGLPAEQTVEAIRRMDLTVRDIVERKGTVLGDADLMNGQFRTAVLLSGKKATLR